MMRRLSRVAWDLARLPQRIGFRRRLRHRAFELPFGAPALNYGGVLIGGRNDVVAGGRVKLLQLAHAWPEREHFNLLYLVSSAPPAHALDLVSWARSQGARLVWNQNGVAFPAWAGPRFEETNRPMAELRQRADFVIYQSDFCKVSADRFLGEVSCPSSVLFNPVDVAAFGPARLPPPLDCWRLLAAGTHYQPARVLGPLEALRLLLDHGQRVHLTIAGALRWPGAEAEVRAAIKRLGVAGAITLRPAFSQADAVALFRGAHLLLHPKYHDPCPTIVIEALACGLPVIGSRSGGMPELVGDDGGELIEVPLSWETPSTIEPRAMTAAISRIMAAWPERSRAARARAERLFDASAWVAAHGRIFESLLLK